jgi:hypothetical protein
LNFKLRYSPFGGSEKYQPAYGNKLALLEHRRQAGYEPIKPQSSDLLALFQLARVLSCSWVFRICMATFSTSLDFLGNHHEPTVAFPFFISC